MATESPDLTRTLPRARDGFLIRATIDRPVTVFMLGVATLVVGWLAYERIPLQLMPDGLASGGCGIYVPVPDSTAREVMEQVTKPAEDFLRTVPGITRITSSSGGRRSNIRLELSPRADPQLMVAEIRDRLDRAKAQWPADVDRYWIWRQDDSDMPIYMAAVSLGIDDETVDVDYLFDEVIKKRLVAIDGVARVNVWGLLDKRVEIGLDPGKVEAHGIQLLDLVTRLSSDNRTVNAGAIRDGDRELLVRVDGKFKDFQEVRDYPASVRFKVGDFASVGYGFAIRDRMSRVNGHRSRMVVINKESSANAVETCDRVMAAFREIEDTLKRTVPGLKEVQSHAWMNQGELIRYSIDSVKESGLWGGFFAIIVLYAFFRHVGMTVLVTLSIPLSFLMTIIWLFFRGQSFNVVSLTGLTLGVGMLVDNSIVVVENILRHRAQGCGPREAAVRGVREVGLAVSLATLTTVIVFLPGVFISDPRIRGMFMALGEPVSISVLASLLVALVFVPQGAIHLERLARNRRSRAMAVSAHELDPITPEKFSRVNHWCARLARWCIGHRTDALLLIFGFLAFTNMLFRNIPKNDLPMDGPRRLEIDLKLPKNFSIREADEVFATVEKSILARKAELRIRAVTCWFSPSEGEVNIFLEPGVTLKEQEFFALLKPHLPTLPGVTYRMGFEDFARNQGGQRVRVFVRGTDLARLEELGKEVKSTLEDRERFPELEEVTEWREVETEEVRVQVARRLAQEYGTDTATVSRMVSWALRGAMLPDFEREDREIPFWINHGERVKENIEVLSSVRVFRPGGEAVRLENLADYRIVPGSGEIHRQNGKMAVGYSARVRGDFQVVREKVDAFFRKYPLPDGFEITMRQDDRGFQQDLKNLLFATGLAMALVCFVMGILFESYVLPLAVLFSIPHAFFGSLFLLWILGVGLDMMGLLGFLMLVGIVVNNAIVLIDCVNQLRLAGIPRTDAIERAVQVRFRPIWMTALTTIFGLLPILFLPQSGEGADYRPLAVVLVGGLTTSTFFTLFAVPLFYVLLDDLRHYVARLGRGSGRRAGAGVAAP